MMRHVGSHSRTMDDLIMLDSIRRTPKTTADELGSLPQPVPCEFKARIHSSLRSNFGRLNLGLSGELSCLPPPLFLILPCWP